MTLAWWQRGVIYQIYPRSFQDTNGDGVGDLTGILRRLDHLAWLGVDALWLSPVFPSPMADFGYDVSDYCGIHTLFGTLADMDALIAAAHARGLKLILDYVPNHTSDQHPWFTDSRAGGLKRDWYLWRDAAPGGRPPNNWLSHFGGPAWAQDAGGQHYCHSFLPAQPDLNWRNPAVQAAMHDVLRFWLDRGVDGFRVDVMWLMVKDAAFRDNPPNLAPAGSRPFDALLPVYTADRPEVQQVVAGLRAVLDEYADRVLIGEIYLPINRLVAYYGEGGRGAHLPFNFHLLQLPEWTATAIADLVLRYEAALPPDGWPNWVLGNHDRPRIASRVGAAQARVAALLLLTLRGTPTLYMGDELGMVDTPIPTAELQDPAEHREPGRGLGRDPVRTPFPWQPGPGGGFTTGKPWLRLGRDASLAEQRKDAGSMAHWHRELLALRRAHPALSAGSIEDVAAQGDVLRYRRCDPAGDLMTLANIGHAPAELNAGQGTILASSLAGRRGESVRDGFTLLPDEAIILRPAATAAVTPIGSP